MNELPYEKLVEWLKEHNVQKTRHSDTKNSGRSLLDHLTNTYDILKAAGQSSDVCNAGLFHSIYGTSHFKIKTLSFADRDVVRGLIGEHSENLAHLFCRLDRPNAFKFYLEAVQSNEDLNSMCLPLIGGEKMRLDEHNLQNCLYELLSIEAANLLEQQVLWRHQWLIEHARISGILSLNDESPITRLTQSHFTQMLENAKQKLLLELAVIINAERQAVTSNCWWAVNLRAMKAMQARAVLNAPNISLVKSDGGLLSNYANVNNMSLHQAAEDVLGKEAVFMDVLVSSEIKKDRLSAEIRRAVNFSRIEAIRMELQLSS